MTRRMPPPDQLRREKIIPERQILKLDDYRMPPRPHDPHKPTCWVDTKDREVIIENERESVLIRAEDIKALRALLEAADDILNSGDGAA